MAVRGAVTDVSIKCSYCDEKEQIMKLCTQCRAILYCSRECQVKDWPSHKLNCSRSKTEKNKNHIVKEMEVQQERKQDMKYSQIVQRPLKSFSVDREICKSESFNKNGFEVTQKENGCDNTHLQDIYKESGWLSHNGVDGVNQASDDFITIFIKHNKEKKKLEIVKKSEERNSSFQQISDFVRIPVEKLKLIHKGRMVTLGNINSFLSNRALFLAFGEVCENEDGLNKSDIDILMKQLNVERNVAVKALQQTETLLDAIIDIGNRL